MLANDIVLDNKDGTDVTYRLVSQQADGTRRINVASTLALPDTLTLKHSVTGKVPSVVDRHLVQVSKTVSTLTGSAPVIVNFTVTVPRDVAVTSAIVYDVITHMVDFLQDGSVTGLATNANIDALLRGES